MCSLDAQALHHGDAMLGSRLHHHQHMAAENLAIQQYSSHGTYHLLSLEAAVYIPPMGTSPYKNTVIITQNTHVVKTYSAFLEVSDDKESLKLLFQGFSLCFYKYVMGQIYFCTLG
jgi:hypothetical protein